MEGGERERERQGKRERETGKKRERESKRNGGIAEALSEKAAQRQRAGGARLPSINVPVRKQTGSWRSLGDLHSLLLLADITQGYLCTYPPAAFLPTLTPGMSLAICPWEQHWGTSFLVELSRGQREHVTVLNSTFPSYRTM